MEIKSEKIVEMVLDIETVKMNLEEDFTDYEKQYLTQFDDEESKFEERMALYPESGKIVSIGCKNIISQKGFVVFHAGEKFKEDMDSEDGSLVLYGCRDEKEILETFWNLIKSMEQAGYKFNRLITFNGKSFDVPFILMRSAVNNVKITHSLGYKGQASFHCDLLEESTFHWKKRKFKLHLVAKTLGIPHHKSEERNGKSVWDWFASGMYEEIASYCYEDVELTEKIYQTLKSSWGTLL
ncbi:MAG TPA: hypothetical protein DHW82_00525 [Spirochaetia bacterium]|nr:MAG: hypothetical protein A2Y41_05315 [Spirochaetes bacterium GWB1_36_13]HCL55484.1 hypothetical protein [Spirochaetia bacterium]